MSAPKTPSVDLTDDVLLRVMRDPSYHAQFPFLATALARSASPRKSGCGGCGRKKRARSVDFMLIRRQIIELPLAEKAKFKALLNTNQVVVRYVRPGGKANKVRF